MLIQIKVIIAAQYINKTNPSFISRKIYGTDTYTAHSDCVCIGVHFGFFGITGFNTKKYEGVEIVFKVVKPKKNYNGSNKNGITS